MKLFNIQRFVREYSSQTDRLGGAFAVALKIAQNIEPPPPPPPPPPPEPEPQPEANNDEPVIVHEIKHDDTTVEIGEGYGYTLESLELMNPDLKLDDNPNVSVNGNTLRIDDEKLFQDVKETVEPWDDFIEADDIAQDVADGNSIDLVAEERGLTRREVLDQLEAGGMEVEVSESTRVSDDKRTTEITNPETGETVTVHYDEVENTYRVAVEDGEDYSTSPLRDSQGRKVTTEENPETGATTTRYEDDLGDGTILEKTELPGGVTVERTTDADGQVITVVIDEEGTRTTLEENQETTREGIDGIAEDVSEGKSIAEIAEERGVTQEQVAAQLEAAGFTLVQNSDELNHHSNRILDAQSGQEIAGYSFTLKSNITTSHYIDPNGVEVRTVEYGNDDRHTETVTEANGRETTTTEDADGEKTVTITHNGYTLTTPPDGDLTLRDNEKGTEVEIERGTPLESLVVTMLETNPQSSDPQEAKEAEIIQTVVEGMLAGESLSELREAAQNLQGESPKASDQGVPPSTNVTYEDPYGDPPPGQAPSGGDWVPINGVWMDPEVAQAIAAENTALAELVEAQAILQQSQAQLDVYALDPDYAEALGNAGATLDEALAPHGLQWKRPEADGSLEDAQARLEGANTQLEDASEAKGEYEQAQELLDEAITEQEEMPFYPDGTTPVLTDPDSDYNYQEEVEKGEAAQAQVDALFYEAALHSSKGDNLLSGYTVNQLERQLEAAEPGTKQHTELEAALEQAEAVHDNAGSQLEASQAYYDFYVAKGEVGQLTLQGLGLEEQLLDDYNARNEFLFEEGKKHSTIGGDYLGEFTGQEVVEREGQLWVVNHFEDGTTEQQLTISPSEVTAWWEENRNLELNKQWHELATGSDPNLCGADGLSSAQRQELVAGRELNEFLKEQLDVQIEDLDTSIGELEDEYNELFERHGPGTVEAPQGIDQTESITIGDQQIEVSPEVKDAYEQQGLDALTESGEPVRVEIDGEWRWVHPELAVTSIALDTAEEQREAAKQSRQQLDANIEMYDYRLTQPIKLLPDSESAEHEASLQYNYLDDNEAEALDGQYQLRFQGLIEGNEYTEDFTALSANELEAQVIDALNLNEGTTQGRETLDKVTEEVHDLGGENAEVRIVPIIYVDAAAGQMPSALFAVKNEDGDTRYVDATGKHFEDLEDFQDNNEKFREDGKLVVPAGLNITRDDDGTIALDVVQASNVSVLEKAIDPVIGIGTGLASVGMIIPNPLSPVFAGITYAGATYLGGRAAYHQWEHIQHGGEWNDKQSVMNTLSVATTIMPMGSSGLRTIGMARYFDDVSRGQAFLASIGAVKPGAELAELSFRYMKSSAGLNRAARGLDWSAIGTGVPMMAVSAYDLALHGDQMSGLDIANALVGAGTGLAGTGLGVHGLRMTRPGQTEINQSSVNPGSGQDSGPHTLSAAYHPEGAPFPEQSSSIPAAFRKPQQIELPAITSGSAWRLPGELNTIAALNPTPDMLGLRNSEPSNVSYSRQALEQLFGATILGRPPKSPESVYIQETTEPFLRSKELQNKTHILQRDEEAGETFITPWIRGGAEPVIRQKSDERLPSIFYEYDERGFWAHSSSDPEIDLKVLPIDSGEVGRGPIITDSIVVTHFDRGGLPPGDGSLMLADLLRAYEIRPIRRLVFEDVINASTLHEYEINGDPAQTVLGRSGERALQELGLEPAAYYFERTDKGRLNLVIDIAQEARASELGLGAERSPRANALKGYDTENSATPRVIYRLDSRSPDTVFQQGFSPRFGNWSRKYNHLEEAVEAHVWADDSVFVSTSSELQFSKGAGVKDEWVYVVVDPKTGINVDEFLGSHEFEGASEILYDFIPGEYIIGARQLGETSELRSRGRHGGENTAPTWAHTYTGEFIRNPSFDSSLWSSNRINAEDRSVISAEPSTARGEELARLSAARVLGHPPESAEQVYVSPDNAAPVSGDSAALSGKTHILVRDPDTGEPVVMPWIRGASEDHILTEAQQAARLETLDSFLDGVTVRPGASGSAVHIPIEIAGPGRFRVFGEEMSPHELLLSNRLKQEAIGDGRPVVLDIKNPSSDATALAQRLSNIASAEVVVPRADDPLQWQVLRPTHGPNEHRPGAVELVDGKLVLTQGAQRQVIEPDGDHLGPMLGAGGSKTAFRIYDKVVVIHRGEAQGKLYGQVEDTQTLIDRGAPYIAPIHGVTQVYGRKALVMDFYTTQNRKIEHGFLSTRDRASLTDVSLLNRNSVSSLREMREFYMREGIGVGDPQFLIDSEGFFYLHDFEDIYSIWENPRLVALIDEHIALAENAINGRGALGPRSLSAAYHPEGAPYPEQPSPIPAAFRKPQQPGLSENTSDSPWRLPNDFTTALARYPTSGVHEAMAAIDPAMLQSSLIDKGVSPETAQAIAAEFDHSNSSTTVHQTATIPAPAAEPMPNFASEDVAGYRPVQLKSISETQIPTIAPEHLAQIPPGRLTHFTPEQVAAFTKDQLAALSIEQVRKLTPPQLKALSPEQITFFTREQLGAFRLKQVAALDGEQMNALGAWKLRALSDVQLQAIRPETLAQIKPNRLMWLWPEQISPLTTEQIKALTNKQIAGLTPGQVAALTRNQAKALSTEQWQAFKPAQIKRFDSERLQLAPQRILEREARPGTISISLDAEGPVIQLHGVNREGLGALIPLSGTKHAENAAEKTVTLAIDRNALSGFLNPVARGMLPDGPQLRVRVESSLPAERNATGQKALIGTGLGFLAAAGYALSSSPTANVLAYGWRGASFIYRAHRPDATAANTIQGRVLRGVEFFTTTINTPGTVMATAQGQDPLINGPYAVGNIAYGSKTFMETVTGKDQFPYADDVGLPAYLIGSMPYTADSASAVLGGDPWAYVDVAAGGLFGYGSAYLWFRDTASWKKGVRPTLARFLPIDMSKPLMVEPQSSELIQPLGEPTPRKRDIAFAITIGGGLIATSMSAFGKLFEPDETDPESDESPSPDQPSAPPSPEQSDQPDQPDEPTPEPTTTQFVVLPADGLNLRARPSDEARIVMTFTHGTFLEETGPREADADGNAWVPVRGMSQAGKEQAGWVMARYVDENASGAMIESGRVNPELEEENYVSVDVYPKETLASIAVAHDRDIAEVVSLNNHIVDPEILYPGDRIYLPKVTQASPREGQLVPG
ncbi:scabin-related ADP-ribosyltransferase [Modicisalibacter muralis]|uniref:scabin-related ADP-ribosyltransferase n=1 Tax=Modicisalibacter muralis TaxID=119000 RepID=UPI001587BCCF|nr:DUF4781 domain-containing protein [Halomonas muralis]